MGEKIWTMCLAAAAVALAAKLLWPKGKLEPLKTVDRMSGPRFERWCAALLRRNGFWRVRVLGGSGDQGADIIAHKGFRKYVIQCKCYKSRLGNKPVQEVNAAVEIYHGQVAVVMTNSYFTSGGVEAGRKCSVLLWDRDKLRKMGAK